MRYYALDVNPEPWAIGPLGVGRRGGRVFPYVGQNAQLKTYQNAIGEALRRQDPEMITGQIDLEFYFWRSRDEYVTPQARTHRKHEADVTNLQKATEDALQGILFKNDKDVISVQSWMLEQGPDIEGMVVIGVQEATSWARDIPIEVTEAINSMRESVPVYKEPDWLPPNGVF